MAYTPNPARDSLNFGNNVFSNTAPSPNASFTDMIMGMDQGIDPNKVGANSTFSPTQFNTVAAPGRPSQQRQRPGVAPPMRQAPKRPAPAAPPSLMGMYGGGQGTGPMGRSFMTSADQGASWQASQAQPDSSWMVSSNDPDGSQWRRG